MLDMPDMPDMPDTPDTPQTARKTDQRMGPTTAGILGSSRWTELAL